MTICVNIAAIMALPFVLLGAAVYGAVIVLGATAAKLGARSTP